MFSLIKFEKIENFGNHLLTQHTYFLNILRGLHANYKAVYHEESSALFWKLVQINECNIELTRRSCLLISSKNLTFLSNRFSHVFSRSD